MKTEIVQIEKIIFGGHGLGRLPGGKVILIPMVIPGERVKAKVKTEYSDYAEGELIEVLEPHPHRINPPCPYFGLCGGCQFQHLAYPHQLVLKKEILLDIFQRQASLTELPIIKFIPSPKTFYFRNRVRFHVEGEDMRIGFVKWKSHQVIKIEECMLAHPQLNVVLKKLYHHPTLKVLLFYLKRIRLEYSPLEDLTALLFWTLVKPREEDVQTLLSIPELKVIFYYLKGARPFGPFPSSAPYGGRKLFSALPNLTYYTSPGVFIQTNWDINLEIQRTLFDLAKDAERVLDLHVGMGNLLLPLVSALTGGKEFLGVDTDPRAIEDALYTTKKNQLNGRVDFRTMSSHACLQELITQARTYDLVILDPPRGGCKEILKYLPEVAKKKILYLSCDPPTLARDVKILLNLGYELQGLYLFDMFPQSYHLEVLALLEKRA